MQVLKDLKEADGVNWLRLLNRELFDTLKDASYTRGLFTPRSGAIDSKRFESEQRCELYGPTPTTAEVEPPGSLVSAQGSSHFLQCEDPSDFSLCPAENRGGCVDIVLVLELLNGFFGHPALEPDLIPLWGENSFVKHLGAVAAAH
tara:strand:+ start:1788 stop:2225 length:438 start_codon:yes stop_codon:yes gene_type:complete